MHGEQPTPAPPLGWRLAAWIGPLALPERYDPWIAARYRRTSRTAPFMLAAWMLGSGAVLAVVGVRARVTTPLLAATISPFILIGVLAGVLQRRRLPELVAALEHPPGNPREKKYARRRGWICFAAVALNLVNLALQATAPGGLYRDLWSGASFGPTCQPPDTQLRAALAARLTPGSTATGVSVVAAGSARAIAMHIDTPPRQAGQIAIGASGDVVLVREPVRRGGLTDHLRFDNTRLDSGGLRIDRTIVETGRWHSIFRDPAPTAQSCARNRHDDPASRITALPGPPPR